MHDNKTTRVESFRGHPQQGAPMGGMQERNSTQTHRSTTRSPFPHSHSGLPRLIRLHAATRRCTKPTTTTTTTTAAAAAARRRERTRRAEQRHYAVAARSWRRCTCCTGGTVDQYVVVFFFFFFFLFVCLFDCWID